MTPKLQLKNGRRMLGIVGKALQVLGLTGFLLSIAWQWQLDAHAQIYPLVADPAHGNIFPEHFARGGTDHFVPSNIKILWDRSVEAIEGSFVVLFLGIGLGNYAKNRPQKPN
jgi:hypothetical protein